MRLAAQMPLEDAAYKALLRLSAQMTEVDPLKVPAAAANPPAAVAPIITPTKTLPAVLEILNINSPIYEYQ